MIDISGWFVMMQLGIITAATAVATFVLVVDTLGRKGGKTPWEMAERQWQAKENTDKVSWQNTHRHADSGKSKGKMAKLDDRLPSDRLQLAYQEMVCFHFL